MGLTVEAFDIEKLRAAWHIRLDQLKAQEKAMQACGGGRLTPAEGEALNVSLYTLKEAYRMLSESTGVRLAVQAYSDELRRAKDLTFKPPYVPPEMDLESALKTLEILLDLDEETIVTVYDMRVVDQPQEEERMRRAMKAVAKARSSERLMRLAETGKDGEQYTGSVAEHLQK